MATKWIKVPVTLHVPGAEFVPFKWDSNGGALEGKYDVVEAPPLTPVELDSAEADRLLKRYENDDRAGEATPDEIAAAKKAAADKAEADKPKPRAKAPDAKAPDPGVQQS